MLPSFNGMTISAGLEPAISGSVDRCLIRFGHETTPLPINFKVVLLMQGTILTESSLLFYSHALNFEFPTAFHISYRTIRMLYTSRAPLGQPTNCRENHLLFFCPSVFLMTSKRQPLDPSLASREQPSADSHLATSHSIVASSPET
jgi:hypothetical protein